MASPPFSGLLGDDRPIAYEDTLSYFKIHLPERRTWVMCRLYFDRKRPCVWVPIPLEQTQQLVPSLQSMVSQLGWSCVNLDSYADLELLGELLQLAWDQQRQLHPAASGSASSPSEPEILDPLIPVS